MLPTFMDNQKILVTKVEEVRRFTVVVFSPPTGDTQPYIKRVIGLPGEKISYRRGQLYVNGKSVADPFGQETTDFTLAQVTSSSIVPKDAYFVLGDNRPHSLDSRSFGFVSREKIYGVVRDQKKK